MILMGYRSKQDDEDKVIHVKGNSGGVRGVRLILTQEFSGRFECRCWQLHTSPGQGTAPGASPRAGNGGKAAQEILNSFSCLSPNPKPGFAFRVE